MKCRYPEHIHPNHFSTAVLTVWTDGAPQWISVILTFLTPTTIARPVCQAASSFWLINHEGCGCRYTETVGEF